MKVGVIFAVWQAGDYLACSLTPWIDARKARLGGNDFVICALSTPFEGFNQPETDNTRGGLKLARSLGAIDHIVESDTPMKETEARGAALRWLVDQGVTHTWQVDADEIYTLEQIAKIADIVAAHPFYAWWRLSLRNAIWTKDQYLVEPFMPPRIHEVRLGVFKAVGFWDDNNVLYQDDEGMQMRDTAWAGFIVPSTIAWIAHYAWLNCERSRLKCEYQARRGWTSSYLWDDKLGLQFNEAYYRAQGLPLPEVARIGS